MGIFGSHKNDPAFGDRIRAAFAMLNGDQNAAFRFQQLQLQRQEEARQQAAADRAEQQRNEQVWGAKEAGVGLPLISALSPGDLSQTLRERFTPYTGSPGSRHVMPSLNGGADTVDATPTTMSQEISELGRIDPRLAASRAAREAIIMNQGVDPSTGQPFAQALDPQSLFPGLSVGGQQPPQLPDAVPQGPDMSAADIVPAEAPAFRPPPGSLAGGPPPNAPRRGAALGNPVQEMTQIVGMPPSSGFRTQRHQNSLVQQGMTPARHSQHTEGNALDFPIPSGPQQQAAAARIRQRYPQARFAFERTNLHVSLPGWGGAPDVSGSRRRYPDGGGGGQVVSVNSPEEAARLPRGTRFRTPDGRVIVRQ